MNYQEAKNTLETAKNPTRGKPLANNTRLTKRGRNYAVQLHATDILTFRPDGATVYNSGGWRTVTTKERMNRYGPLGVYSDRGTWKIGGALYADGCRVLRDGRVIGAASDRKAKAEGKLRKRIGKFARDYVAALYAGEIDAPGAGDCWICGIVSATGEKHRDASHIVSHIDESYFVPRLIWDALDAGHYGDGYKRDVAILQKLPGSSGMSPTGGFVREQLTRAVRKYCLKQCGMSA